MKKKEKTKGSFFSPANYLQKEKKRNFSTCLSCQHVRQLPISVIFRFVDLKFDGGGGVGHGSPGADVGADALDADLGADLSRVLLLYSVDNNKHQSFSRGN